MNYYIDVLKKYAVFEGRATRKEYWMFTLLNALVSIAIGIISGVTDLAYLSNIYTLAVLTPSLAVASRRLHDTGRTAWWLFLSLIPLIGAFALLIFMVLDSQTGTNIYGPNPKGDSYVSQKTNVWLIVALCVAALIVILIAAIIGIAAFRFVAML